MQENPIDDLKVAENPGLMGYAHTAGGAVIRPEDMGKVKGKAQMAMRQQTFDQLEKVYQQMEVLAQQAKAIKDRIEVSEKIYNAQMGFEPVINHCYFLYEKLDGGLVLSMVSPDEWGRKFPFNCFIAEALLLADHTRKVVYVDGENRDKAINID